jgi:hypothetical protein
MTAVLAVATFTALFKEIPEYCFYGLSMCKIRLVKRHHVDEDDMALVKSQNRSKDSASQILMTFISDLN